MTKGERDSGQPAEPAPMMFICPIASDAMPAWQVAGHAGLLLGVLVGGLIFLVAGVVAFRRPPPLDLPEDRGI